MAWNKHKTRILWPVWLVCWALASQLCVPAVCGDNSTNASLPMPETDVNSSQRSFHFGYEALAREHHDQWHDAMYIMHPVDQLPHDGYVISWHIFASLTGNITFQIWRPVSGEHHMFTLEGYNNFTITSAGVNDFIVNEKKRISFREGDLLGMYYPQQNPVPFSKGGDNCAMGTMYVQRPCPFSKCRKYAFREKQAGWNPCRTYSIYAMIVNASVQDNTQLDASSSDSTPQGESSPSDSGEPSAINVRLANGRTPNEGMVMVQSPGSVWGTVCDDGWDDADATVVCRQLGYSQGGYARYPPFFGRGDSELPIYLDDLQCNGTEVRIAACPRGAPWRRHNCNHREDVGTECINATHGGATGARGALHVFGYPAVDRPNVDKWKQGVFIPNPSQKLPWSKGTIHSWHFYLRLEGGDTVDLSLQVWRKKSDTQFQLIGHTKFTGLPTGRHDKNLTQDEYIKFEAGDVIGVKFDNFNSIPYDIKATSCLSGERVLYMLHPVPQELDQGSVYTFDEKPDDWKSCRVYSLYATYDGTERSKNYQFAYGRSQYKVIKDTTRGAEAAARQCELELGRGSSLANISSEEEFIVLNGALNAMGLSVDDEFWIDGLVSDRHPHQFDKWAHCEPARGRECIALKKQYKDDSYTPDFYYMHARRCSESRKFICQKVPDLGPGAFTQSTTPRVEVSLRTGKDFRSMLPPPTTSKTISVLRQEVRRKGPTGGLITGVVFAMVIIIGLVAIATHFIYRKMRRRSRHCPNDISESSVRFVSLYDKAQL